MTADPRIIPGASVRLIQTRGEVVKRHHGRRMTVRCASADGTSILCDDGDPSNPNLRTNGFRLALWVAVRAVEWTP